MDKQIPGVGDESAGQNGSSRGQVEDHEANPYLPEDLVYSLFRARVMDPVRYWGDGMQHKAMSDVFSQRERHDTATKQNANNG
jgi:hypothetical protein